MSIKADFLYMEPTIEVETTNFVNRGNFATVKIGDLEIDLDEKDAKYLMSELDSKLFDETKEDLDNKIDEQQEEIERLNNLLSKQEVA